MLIILKKQFLNEKKINIFRIFPKCYFDFSFSINKDKNYKII